MIANGVDIVSVTEFDWKLPGVLFESPAVPMRNAIESRLPRYKSIVWKSRLRRTRNSVIASLLDN